MKRLANISSRNNGYACALYKSLYNPYQYFWVIFIFFTSSVIFGHQKPVCKSEYGNKIPLRQLNVIKSYCQSISVHKILLPMHKKLTVLKILKSISNVLNVSSKFISTESTALNVSIEGHSTDVCVLKVFQSL